MGHGRRPAGTALTLLALSTLAGGLAGCASGASSGSSSAAAVGGPAGGRTSVGPAASTAKVPAGELSAIASRIPSAVVKTAAIRLQVGHGKIQAAVGRIGDKAARLGGVTSRSQVVHVGQPVGTIVVRVPSPRFEQALDAIRRAGQVRSETVQGRDVGQQFVDLNARLVNLRAQERVLRGLMNRAATVSGSILVENELSQVQLQIEQVTGQVLYLQNRASLSTIAVTVVQAGAAPVVHQHAGALWKAGRRAVEATVAVIGAVIVGLGYLVPLALLAGLALGAIRLLGPRLPGAAPRGGGPADA